MQARHIVGVALAAAAAAAGVLGQDLACAGGGDERVPSAVAGVVEAPVRRSPVQPSGLGPIARDQDDEGGPAVVADDPPELPPVADPEGSDLRRVDPDDRAGVAAAALDLALFAFPEDHPGVDLTRSVPGEPLAVESNCGGAPDYDVTPLYDGGRLSGVVVTDRVGTEEVQLAVAQPLGPAYRGIHAGTDHAAFEAHDYPPVGADQAIALVAAQTAAAPGEWTGLSYECLDGRPSLQTFFWHNVTSGNQMFLVSAISGDVVALD